MSMSAEVLEFIDTNILVYAHDVTAGEKHIRAKKLIQRLQESRQGSLSVQVLQEFYVTVTRIVSKPISGQEAYQIIQSLSAWKIYTSSPGDVLEAIQIQQRYRVSFWDAMIIQYALQLGASALWSEDLNVGQNYGGIRVSNPFISVY